MSIAIKQLDDDFHYVKTLLEREKGLLPRESQSFIQKLKGNHNYQIIQKKAPSGFLSIRFEKELLFLHTFVLDKRVHKQREIGSKVMDRLEREAKRRNKHAIYCYALKSDRAKIDWYEKHGFTLTDQGREFSVLEKSIPSKRRASFDENYLLIHFPL